MHKSYYLNSIFATVWPQYIFTAHPSGNKILSYYMLFQELAKTAREIDNKFPAEP